jgi:hypothetical protein
LTAACPAKALCDDILGWLAQDPARLGRFLADTGLAPQDLRPAMAQGDLDLPLIDFLLADEARLLEFCAAQDIAPTLPARLRQTLPGGNDPHWT